MPHGGIETRLQHFVIHPESEEARRHGRTPSEVSHTDDMFFDGRGDLAAGTVVTPAGGGTYTQNEEFGSLGLKLRSAAALTDMYSVAWALTPTSSPVTIESRIHLLSANEIGTGSGIAFGFSDGTAVSSNIGGWLGRVEQLGGALETWYLEGTFDTATLTAGLNHHISLQADPLYIRFAWTTTNTFNVNFTKHPSQWTQQDRTTEGITLTPTHFWVGINCNQADDAIAIFDYVRVYETDETV